MVRVLRPGGRVLIQDFRHTAEYERVSKDSGATDVRRSGRSFLIFPPVRVVSATKA
jgi:ubiquinone/menaquinone biosynthesis C-methylase UbiE